MNKINITLSSLSSFYRNSFTVVSAMRLAFSMGYPYTPVLIDGKAIVFSPLETADFNELQ